MTLTPDEKGIVLEALKLASQYGPLKAWHDEKMVLDLNAFAALSSGEKDANKRNRVFVNRMLGKPDRSEVPKPSPRYSAARVVADYLALTGRSDPGEVLEHYALSRRNYGLSNLTRFPSPCLRHPKPEKFCDVCDPFEPLTLPLSRIDALTAVRTRHSFPSELAALRFLERHGAKMLPALR